MQPNPGADTMIVMTLDMKTAAGAQEDIIRTFRQLIGPTEFQPGCLGCGLLEDLRGEQKLHYMEMWTQESDFLRRVRSEQFKKVLAVMELSSEPPTFRMHTISKTRGLDVIEEIRQAKSASANKLNNTNQGLSGYQE
jgi:quinol monooxygenase YgiN